MATEPSWYRDPTGAHELRYWDGTAWTEHVSDRGKTSTAPVHAPPPPVAAAPVAQAATLAPPMGPTLVQPAPASVESAAAKAPSKPWFKRPVPLIAIAAVVVIAIAAAANAAGGGSGGSTTFPVSNLVANELEINTFFDGGIVGLGTFEVVAGIPACDADVALSSMEGDNTDWPPAIKVPYEKVIADLQREQVACANLDQAAFTSANDDAVADLAAAGRAWDAAQCKVDDVFAESPTATCKN